MPVIEANSTRLAYQERGEGTSVLFVHGGLADFRTWSDQLTTFARRHRAIALSCRYYCPNDSIGPNDDLRLETIVEDLAAFIRAMGIAPSHLVGHSSPGGFGSLLLARDHPELVRSLVLLEPPVLPLLGVSLPPRPAQIASLFLRHPTTALAVARFGRRGLGPARRAFERGDDARGIEIFATNNLGADGWARVPPEVRRQMLQNVAPLKAQIRAGFPAFDANDARRIHVPTLVLTGGQSSTVLQRISSRLAQLIPDAESAQIEGASHGMFKDDPEAFDQVVLAFLARHQS
jgi:pimeloyl-ACP methyl ester carboxylesterase